ALQRLRPQAPPATRKAILHGDFWPGNTLWLRGRLTGVVDWENPWIGNPAMDVSYCRQDLAILFDVEVADRFLSRYERTAGRRIDDCVFWDLIAVTRALPEIEHWLLGYHDLGRSDISPALMRERHRAFMDQALSRAA
ncbi:MAG: aminoglycoside phosphotransferase family protein, partial [Chloroflexi bacterium]|nr:aminoglycoside phosphotransferase family protein [Chloroflexota bacterium]